MCEKKKSRLGPFTVAVSRYRITLPLSALRICISSESSDESLIPPRRTCKCTSRYAPTPHDMSHRSRPSNLCMSGLLIHNLAATSRQPKRGTRVVIAPAHGRFPSGVAAEALSSASRIDSARVRAALFALAAIDSARMRAALFVLAAMRPHATRLALLGQATRAVQARKAHAVRRGRAKVKAARRGA